MVEGTGGEIQESVKTPEVAKPPFDAVLVFGQGPVIGEKTRLPAQHSGEEPGSEDVNFWSKELTKAATTLYKEKQVGKVIVMGGPTGGADYASEAALIAKPLKEAGIPTETEESSTNTLSNLVNLINEHPEIMQPDMKLAILGSDYHLSRIRQLMEMFEMPYAGVFSAEAVTRYTARSAEEWDDATLNELDRRLDINAAAKTPTELAPGYYSQKAGTEQKDVSSRVGEEYIYSRALLDEPRYWLGYVGGIDNTDLMMKIVGKQDPKELQEVFAIDVASDTPESIRAKLLPFRAEKRFMRPAEELLSEPYPEDALAKLAAMVEKRTEKS